MSIPIKARYGMIHGRFQPFHRGHLRYALAALARCEHLIVGITNPDPSLIVREETDRTRHHPSANVFSFFERLCMIRAALCEAGVGMARVSIVPFPIHHPERWRFYCPAEAVHFVRLFSPWGGEKVRRLRGHGWVVEVLDEGAAKEVSGGEVRARLREGHGWEELVPRAVAEVLREIRAPERLRQIDGGK
ncbi:MAG: adenylyltransferase/cytidyltransferase family protein [Thermodesulfobacteriota bacterium]|jgi:cytidyltransferase-like protein